MKFPVFRIHGKDIISEIMLSSENYNYLISKKIMHPSWRPYSFVKLKLNYIHVGSHATERLNPESVTILVSNCSYDKLPQI